MAITASIVCDSVSEAGKRLTTFSLTLPRCILAELNTHRMLCLAGETELEFDLPGALECGERRVHKMRLDEFVNKWNHGAQRTGANPKRRTDLSWIEDERRYSANEVASQLGLANPSNLHRLCREGFLDAVKGDDGRSWLIKGSSLKAWRLASPEHTRFDIRARLMQMNIRQLNEATGEVQHAHVVNAYESGEKEVYRVTAGDYQLCGSKDHLVLTDEGWKRIGDLQQDNCLVVRKWGRPEEERADPLRLKKIDGRWRNKWQNEQRQRLISENPLCRRCLMVPGSEIHHLVPVYQEPSLAFCDENITLLCDSCHNEAHAIQGWQVGNRLYASLAKIDNIESEGVRMTYDLEISGEFPNFFGNGVVVHNSRNAGSSRAIPVERILQQVEEDPFVPLEWGLNQPGMVATVLASEELAKPGERLWLQGRDEAVKVARRLMAHGFHKQVVNRLLEPWMWVQVVCSATEWDNFYHLRCAPDAEPHFRRLACAMRDAQARSTPTLRLVGSYHLPYIVEKDWEDLLDSAVLPNSAVMAHVSAGRCAAVSYHRQERRDPVKDYERGRGLATNGHWSPLEHQAAPAHDPTLRSGNFVGWFQRRHWG